MLQGQLSEDSQSILTQELEKFNNSIFEIPNFDSKTYKKNICEVFKKVEQIEDFTEDLQKKVDNLLAAQQEEFVHAYTQHMRKIKEQFKAFESQALKQQQLIKYYENEGKMSNLVKKVAMLEEESKKLYAVIAKKQKQIKSVNLDIRVQKQENKRLMNQIKEMLREKNKIQTLQSKNFFQNKTQFFATQLDHPELDKSIKKDLSRTTDEKGKIGFSYQLSENSIIRGREGSETHYDNSLRKKINQLQLKNKKLAALNTKVLDSRSQLQNLFLDAVTEIRKQVKLRKKTNYCSYEDFKKEDKITLLVTIISNEELLKVVYEKLFSKNSQPSTQNLHLNPQQQAMNRESQSEYLHTYTKYKRQKQSVFFQNTQLNKKDNPKDNLSEYRHSRKAIGKRGRTEDISVLPYL